MKKKLHTFLTAMLALILCIAFGTILLAYTKPMEGVSLDLSLMSNEDNPEIIAPEDFDCKGWTVYTQEVDVRTELETDGSGAYLEIEPGQTFYYSRVREEELESPTLKIDPADRKFSVWLDDNLIYTDCPELDNQIGSVTLPMNEWDRTDSISISLPMDYHGKTLTIAQSTLTAEQSGSNTAFPAQVTHMKVN